MKILIAGAAGQLGQCLAATLTTGTATTDVEILALGRADLDITDSDAVLRLLSDARPDVVINAAAYTQVDQAEDDEAAAFAINADGAANLARGAAAANARLIHVSTDYVFDGQIPQPRTADDAPAPIGVYGRSKRAGEERVVEALGDRALIVRTAWVYSAYAGNFVKTMLRLMAEKPSLSVVVDQIGTPTWGESLAAALWAAAARPTVGGVLHWSDAGVASWYDFAVAIQEEALTLGLLSRAVPIDPVSSAQFASRAPRPPYSVLDSSAARARLEMPAIHWRTNLRRMLAGLAA